MLPGMSGWRIPKPGISDGTGSLQYMIYPLSDITDSGISPKKAIANIAETGFEPVTFGV